MYKSSFMLKSKAALTMNQTKPVSN